ncbi:MAG: YebC/PmpR family DNA-binding transcriptional regulator [Candidatus Pelagibacter sp.]|nr:YebC/PmpR family DNA-binding transcriptional regulator [Candidatus Pelagibacter sp.]MAK12198.1 YebC/PmpR family DNA-binding transcriptional regulator [Candidatus Pelagibacter sp.]|tara:strand:+ start:923 stop:1663 length:741 start_codon:yes stop_codon:yes gene_type:complete
MAGHSHWAGIKHKKGKADKQRSKLFSKLSREITVAAKIGVPDPSMNPRLRSAIQSAKESNMPKDNIDRAIKKSQGGDEANYESVVYEGFGPLGVGIIVEALTDNKNRTISNVRSIFEKNGYSLGSEGSVSHQFDICGLIKLKKENYIEDEVFEISTNSGANDFKVTEDFYEIYSKKNQLHSLQIKLEKKYKLIFSGIVYNPKNMIKINKVSFEKIINFIETLEYDDDVQKVYSNFEVDQKILQELS